MKTLICGLALLAVAATASAAVELQTSHLVEQFSYSQVQMPPLPPQYQNHCDTVNGHYVCADRCGASYQVYYCPNGGANGCCHVGLGYCDASGKLRCAASSFDARLIR
jgi:hypothetical protein